MIPFVLKNEIKVTILHVKSMQLMLTLFYL